MRYVAKPVPVEAVFLDSIHTGLEFLLKGEYVLVSSTCITLRDNGALVRAYVGRDYIVRDEAGVQPMLKEIFEDSYIGWDTATKIGDFTAYEHDDGTWSIECKECGPLAMVASGEDTDLSDIASAHIAEAHQDR